MSVVVGVISDTHGLLRPEAAGELTGCARIIHAGDTGDPAILEALARIAPVDAVRGNIDAGAWARKLPLTRTIEIEGVRIYVVHNAADIEFDAAARGYAAVISGHSHQPRNEMRDGVLYLNPGSAGPRRFRLPVTIARLFVDRGSVTAQIVPLIA